MNVSIHKTISLKKISSCLKYTTSIQLIYKGWFYLTTSKLCAAGTPNEYDYWYGERRGC